MYEEAQFRNDIHYAESEPISCPDFTKVLVEIVDDMCPPCAVMWIGQVGSSKSPGIGQTVHAEAHAPQPEDQTGIIEFPNPETLQAAETPAPEPEDQTGIIGCPNLETLQAAEGPTPQPEDQMGNSEYPDPETRQVDVVRDSGRDQPRLGTALQCLPKTDVKTGSNPRCEIAVPRSHPSRNRSQASRRNAVISLVRDLQENERLLRRLQQLQRSILSA
ncbi:MAG: hypothetical protein Q9182_006470 [Xanthomendoza sp. 2 TL-2023]